jgi:predicted DNA-binding transcriptional regulator YafY
MSRASSQWEVTRRCLHILARLEQGPASKNELIALAGYLDISSSAAAKRFENDMRRLRESLHIDIGYNYTDKVYELRQATSTPLLDLSASALQGLAFLDDTFLVGSPQYQNVRSLLGTLVALLSDERRSELARARTALSIDLRQRDQDELDEGVWQKLEIANLQQRIVQFDYLSPQQEDQQPRQHLVEARKLYFDTVRSHYYLWAYCRLIKGPHGDWSPKRFFRYRIGRIIPGSVEVLPTRFPAVLPLVPLFPVVYRLSPQVARLGISQHFEKTKIEFAEDESALIHAETDDVFHAARTLLHYGANCMVLGGDELLREFRQIVQAMAKLYES